VDDGLLQLVVCPITRSRLHREGDYLVSEVGGVKYPIKDGLPVLLPSAAILPAGVTAEALRARQAEAKR
jgi:uncharacterized protein YbaR (Trm112 family)